MWFPQLQLNKFGPDKIGQGHSHRIGLKAYFHWLISMSILFLISCNLTNSPKNGVYLSLESSANLSAYHRVAILMSDTMGNVQDTLYFDSLSDPSLLKKLPADKYKGNVVKITIKGYLQNTLAYQEVRLYDGKSQQVLSLDIAKTLPKEILPPTNPNTNAPPSSTANLPVNIPVTSPITSPANPLVVPPSAPSIDSIPFDTVLSIRDSVTLESKAYDRDGDLAAYSWDCNGDGIPEDSGAIQGFRATIQFGKRFKDVGQYSCKLSLFDKGKRQTSGTVKIKIELDPPTAIAGLDTTVTVGTKILLHAKGYDGLGSIWVREWKIGSGEFKPVLQQETFILAPTLPTDLTCVLRVMDSDSLYAQDTLMVHVVAPSTLK